MGVNGKFKRALLLLLALIMSLSLCGCGGSGSGGSGKDGDSDASGDGELSQDSDPLNLDASGSTDLTGGIGDIYSDLDLSCNTYSEARFTADGLTGFIPLGNGECIEIHDDSGINFAAVSPNREHIVVLLKTHELYVTDILQKEKNVLSYSCTSSRVYPSDEGLGFQEGSEKNLVLYSFSDGSLTDLGACDEGLISENKTAAAAIAGDTLHVYSRAFGGVRSFSIAGNSPDLIGVSDDGGTVIWTEETDKSQTEKLYTLGEDGTVQAIGDIQVRGFVYATFTSDGRVALITSDAVSRVYLKNASGQWACVDLPGEWKNETGVYETDSGLLHEVGGDEVGFIYLRCGGELCAVSVDGALTVLRSDVRDFDIIDGVLYYSDSDLDIYSASLDGDFVSGDTLLLSGPDAFAVSPDGQYLYGLTVHSDDKKVRTLSVFPIHGESSEQTVLSENIYADSHVYISSDDGRVYFVDDILASEDGYYVGTLKVYNPVSGETKTIDSDVMKNTFVNGKTYVLLSEYAQSVSGAGKLVAFHGDLAYRKLSDSGSSLCDWYYYDGENPILMVSGLDN